MGKLRKIGRKIKKGVKKLFSSKIGSIVGMVGLYFAMGAVAKGLTNFFGQAGAKTGATVTEEVVKEEVKKEAVKDAVTKEISEVAAGKDALSKKVSTLIETSPTNVDAANQAFKAIDSSAIAGNTMPSPTLTEANTNLIDSNILDQNVAEVNNNLVLKENMIGSDMLAENTIKPELNFMEGASKDVTNLTEQVDLTPPIGELEGFDKVRQAGSNVRRGAREYFVGDESTFIPDTISGVGTGLIAQQFAPDEEPMGSGFISPQPVQVQAQAAYVQEVGPMMANVTGVPNFSNFTQMANQNVYGIGTPNHLAGLYG